MVLLIIPTNRTSEHFLLSVTIVIASDWTPFSPQTFWQLLFSILAHVVTLALSLMARLAKMSISPTKPLGNTTAKFTFKFDKIFAMLRTIFNRDLTTSRADELFWLEISTCILCLIHGRYTIFPSSKIRLFTFETHEIGVYYACILLWFPEVRGFFIFQLFISLL